MGKELHIKQDEFIVLKKNYEVLTLKSQEDLNNQKAFALNRTKIS